MADAITFSIGADNSHFRAVLTGTKRLAEGGMKAMAKGITAESSGAFDGVLKSVKSSIGGAIGSLARTALVVAPLAAAATAAAGGFVLLKNSIGAAAETQSLQASMATLLGSVPKAQERMQELAKFAASTPFEIPGVVRASNILQTLTGGALATGEGLRLVGDAASVANQPIEEIAVWIGRLYDGLQNGAPVGEAMQRLQELGLVSSQTRQQIETLQKSGARGDQVWNVAAKSLHRFDGEMLRQSGTWNGLMSNLSDTVGQLYRAFGEPIISGLSPYLEQLTKWLGGFTKWAAGSGEIFAGWSTTIAKAVADGRLGDILQFAFGEAVNYLYRGLVTAATIFKEIMGRVMFALVSEDFLNMLQSGLTAAFSGIGALLIGQMEEALIYLTAGIEKAVALTGKDPAKEAAKAEAEGLRGEIDMIITRYNNEDDLNKRVELGDMMDARTARLSQLEAMTIGNPSIETRAAYLRDSGLIKGAQQDQQVNAARAWDEFQQGWKNMSDIMQFGDIAKAASATFAKTGGILDTSVAKKVVDGVVSQARAASQGATPKETPSAKFFSPMTQTQTKAFEFQGQNRGLASTFSFGALDAFKKSQGQPFGRLGAIGTNSSLGAIGAMGQAYGRVRRGDAARRRAEEAKKAKEETDKKKNTEGTNERLDSAVDEMKKLNKKFET